LGHKAKTKNLRSGIATDYTDYTDLTKKFCTTNRQIDAKEKGFGHRRSEARRRKESIPSVLQCFSGLSPLKLNFFANDFVSMDKRRA
jgi:hypothetical protein